MKKNKLTFLTITIITTIILFICVLFFIKSDKKLKYKIISLKYLPERVLYKLFPGVGSIMDKLPAQEKNAIEELASKLKGKIVWASNRSGNHELYIIDLKTETVKRLTNNPHVDYFSKFSPDGEWIAFIRSQREWVSFRETTAWDLYIVKTDGTEERLIEKSAIHPSFTNNSKHIIYLKDNKVYKESLETNDTIIICDGNSPPINGNIGGPALSDDGNKLALTTPLGLGVLDLITNDLKIIYKDGACEVIFGRNDNELIWIVNHGKGGTQVMYSSIDNPNPQTLIDLPFDYSHEYFPRISNDRKWLIWGASARGHEHDQADYEIFLWEIGTPWETSYRLTYYSGNDQWPDIYIPQE